MIKSKKGFSFKVVDNVTGQNIFKGKNLSDKDFDNITKIIKKKLK